MKTWTARGTFDITVQEERNSFCGGVGHNLAAPHAYHSKSLRQFRNVTIKVDDNTVIVRSRKGVVAAFKNWMEIVRK